jgi:hypothetical protein
MNSINYKDVQYKNLKNTVREEIYCSLCLISNFDNVSDKDMNGEVENRIQCSLWY